MRQSSAGYTTLPPISDVSISPAKITVKTSERPTHISFPCVACCAPEISVCAGCLHLAAIVTTISTLRENVHQVGSILFEKKFIITQLAMFYLLLRFDHHRRPSSGTECSVVTAH